MITSDLDPAWPRPLSHSLCNTPKDYGVASLIFQFPSATMNNETVRIADFRSVYRGGTKLTVDVVVEIPQGSQNKYEVDHETGRVRLDRVLHASMHYPAEYGFIEETLGEDDDPIDVLVLSSFPTFPGCIVATRILGMLEMSDEKGVDTKLLGVAADDPRYNPVQRLEDVNPHTLREIPHFFATYKQLENKEVTIGSWKGAADALKVLEESRHRYQSQH